MKLFLTGGTGFFGKALLGYLAKKTSEGLLSVEVTVMSRNPDIFLKENPQFRNLTWLKFHKGNVLEFKSFPLEKDFTHILHAATESTVGPSLTPMQRFYQIVDGTKNALNFAIACPAKQFLLTSSGAIYGAQQEVPFEESMCNMPDVLDPENAYGVGKRVAEHLCALYKKTYGIDYVIARCFAFVGEDLPDDAHFAIGNFIEDALVGRDILVKSTGLQKRTYMYQADLAKWLFKILLSGKSGEAYNVGSDYEISIKDLAFLVRDVVNPKIQVTILGKDSLDGRNSYTPSIKKAKSQLGLSTAVSLEEAIALTAKIKKKRKLMHV